MPNITLLGAAGAAAPATPLAGGSLAIIPQLLVSGMTTGVALNAYALRATKMSYGGGASTVVNEGGYANSAGGSASTSGNDADGAASLMTGTEANASAVKTESKQIVFTQFRWGWYAWTRFKLPTTMTDLTNRGFGWCALADNITGNMDNELNAANLSAATTVRFVSVRWRQGTNNANWSVRVGDGTNAEDALDTGIAVVTGTLYHMEMFAIPPAGTVYLRINGGANQQIVSARLPSVSFNFTGAAAGTYGLRSINNAAVTGTGAIAHNIYQFGLLAA